MANVILDLALADSSLRGPHLHLTRGLYKVHIVILISHMSRLRLREANPPAQGHIESVCLSPESTLCSHKSKSCFFEVLCKGWLIWSVNPFAPVPHAKSDLSRTWLLAPPLARGEVDVGMLGLRNPDEGRFGTGLASPTPHLSAGGLLGKAQGGRL